MAKFAHHTATSNRVPILLLCILSAHVHPGTHAALTCPPSTRRCDVYQPVAESLTTSPGFTIKKGEDEQFTVYPRPHTMTWNRHQQIIELELTIQSSQLANKVGFSVRHVIERRENKFFFGVTAAERHSSSAACFSIFLTSAQMPAEDMCASLSEVSKFNRTVVLNTSALLEFYERNPTYQAGKKMDVLLYGADTEIFENGWFSRLGVPIRGVSIPANHQCKPVRLESRSTADKPAGIAQVPWRSDGIKFETTNVNNVTTHKTLAERIGAPTVVLTIQVSRELLGKARKMLVVLERDGNRDDLWDLVPQPQVIGNGNDGGERFTLLLTTDAKALESSCYKLMADGLANGTGHHLIAESKVLAEVYKSGNHFHGAYDATVWVVGMVDGPGESQTAVWKRSNTVYIPGCEDFGWSRSAHWTTNGSSGPKPMCTACVPPQTAVKNFSWCLEGQNSLQVSWVSTAEPGLVDHYHITVNVVDVHGGIRTMNQTSIVSNGLASLLHHGEKVTKMTMPDVADSIDSVHRVDIVEFVAVCRNPANAISTPLALDLSEQLAGHSSPYCHRGGRTLPPRLTPSSPSPPPPVQSLSQVAVESSQSKATVTSAPPAQQTTPAHIEISQSKAAATTAPPTQQTTPANIEISQSKAATISAATLTLVVALLAVLLLMVMATIATLLCVRKRRLAANADRCSKEWSCFSSKPDGWVGDKEVGRQESPAGSGLSSPALQYASPTRTLSECGQQGLGAGGGVACGEAPAPTVYLAYDRRDLAKVSELHHALEWFGVNSILDKHYHRDSPAEWLEEQLGKADFILAVLSHDFPHSTTSMKGKLPDRSDVDLDHEFEEAESKKLLSLWFHRSAESPTPLCAYLQPYEAVPHSTLSGVKQAHKYNVDSRRLRHDFAGRRFCPEMRSLLYRLYSVDEAAVEIVFPPSKSGKSTPSFVLPCASPSVA